MIFLHPCYNQLCDNEISTQSGYFLMSLFRIFSQFVNQCCIIPTTIRCLHFHYWINVNWFFTCMLSGIFYCSVIYFCVIVSADAFTLVVVDLRDRLDYRKWWHISTLSHWYITSFILLFLRYRLCHWWRYWTNVWCFLALIWWEEISEFISNSTHDIT